MLILHMCKLDTDLNVIVLVVGLFIEGAGEGREEGLIGKGMVGWLKVGWWEGRFGERKVY